MASITDILNSLFQAARETGAGKGSRSASLLGMSGESQSFEEVLARMEAEDGSLAASDFATSSMGQLLEAEFGNGEEGILSSPLPNTSVKVFRPMGSIAEVDVRMAETISASEVDFQERAGQALSSFAFGLGELLQVVSQFGTQNLASAEKVLDSVVGDLAHGVDAKNLFASVKALMEGVPDSQNPLLVSRGERDVLLGQWIQQMVQSQQMLFGNFLPQDSSVTEGQSSGLAMAGTSIRAEFSLKISFSEMDVNAAQVSDDRVSRVFINLQTFQMSATFIRSDVQDLSSASNSRSAFQPLEVTDFEQLKSQWGLSAVDLVSFSDGSKPISADIEGLRQNFKQLVQLLMSFGVSRAALTSFVNQQPKTSETGGGSLAAQEIPFQPTNFSAPVAGVESLKSFGSEPSSVLGSLRQTSFSNDTPQKMNNFSIPFDWPVPLAPAPVPFSGVSVSWLNAVAQSFEGQAAPAIFPSAAVFMGSFLSGVSQNSEIQVMAKVPVSSETLTIPAGLGIQMPDSSEKHSLSLLVSSSADLGPDLGGAETISQIQMKNFLVSAPGIILKNAEFQPISKNSPIAVVAGETLKISVPVPENTVLRNNSPQPSSVDFLEIKPLLPLAVTSAASISGSSVLPGLDDQVIKETFQSNFQQLGNGTVLVGQQIANGNSIMVDSSGSGDASVKADVFGIWDKVSSQISIHSSELRAFSRLSIQLIPESLGRVTVQIALVDSAISAKIIVATPEVRETLQNHMVDLKASLSQAGLQIDQLQVQVQGGSSNLLAQYFQYQQEGYGNSLPSWSGPEAVLDMENIERADNSNNLSTRMSLVDLLV